jgi:hypothetical protein
MSDPPRLPCNPTPDQSCLEPITLPDRFDQLTLGTRSCADRADRAENAPAPEGRWVGMRYHAYFCGGSHRLGHNSGSRRVTRSFCLPAHCSIARQAVQIASPHPAPRSASASRINLVRNSPRSGS